MNRRAVIRVLTATGAALTVAATVGSAADDQRGEADLFSACGKACRDCLADCEGCYRHCADLLAGGQRDHAATSAVCLDCAELCAATPSGWADAARWRRRRPRRARRRAKSAVRRAASSPTTR